MTKTVKIENSCSFGILWCIGWLFSIGYLKLGFWKGLLAIIVWPYFIGAHHAAPDAGSTTDARAIEWHDVRRDFG